LPQSNVINADEELAALSNLVSASLLKQRDNSREQRARTADDHRCHFRKAKFSAANGGLLAVFYAE
jgi:hypothetical protein